MSEQDLVYSDKQMDFLFESDARINVATGAVSAGKTHICNTRWERYILEDCPETHFPCVLAAKTQDTVLENIVRPIQEEVGQEHAYTARNNQEFWLFGKRHQIVGAYNANAESRIRGKTFAGGYGDELTLWPDWFFKMFVTRFRVPGAKMFGTTNPDSPKNFVKTDIIDKVGTDSSIKHWHFLMDDNDWLVQNNPEYIRAMKSFFHGPFYKRMILGEWALAEGLVYLDSFSPERNVVDVAKVFVQRKGKPFRYHFVGVDYAASDKDALAYLLFGTDSLRGDKPVYVLKEFYYKADPMNGKPLLLNSQMLEKFRQFLGGIRPNAVYVDPGGGGKSLETELRYAGYPVKQPDKSVLDGIGTVADWLGRTMLLIDKSCKHLIEEFTLYVFDDRSIETKPKKGNDHALDALRYAIHSIYGTMRRIFYVGGNNSRVG